MYNMRKRLDQPIQPKSPVLGVVFLSSEKVLRQWYNV